VLDRVISSFNSGPMVVCLVQDRLFQLNVLPMFLDAVFNSVLDVQRVIGVLRVVRGNWHDPCGQQVLVTIEDVVGAVSKHPHRLSDGECVTCDARRRLLIRLLSLCELRRYRNL